ncbi:hypothetical protein RND71_012795 [Anisodus tanguticus]|uniref:Uncharacterized protein n=1 Tax=Anisodus tanguticus TaxID=243964 RepID=A0AAE1SGK6_9SOLA|nr:hypothetical protein RND71_012795 [Anisodus tanguticus]
MADEEEKEEQTILGGLLQYYCHSNSSKHYMTHNFLDYHTGNPGKEIHSDPKEYGPT